ncbi:hypothetical protein [Hydrogenimonas sp. SS33]|uniref:hypothetical protein n=1 Tax=Hydrogenimonas leucolamina TaxID=2954236 RepID=UPI00336C2FEB
MHLKRYTLASLLLMAIVGWYVYQAISPADYTLTILGEKITLPLAVWVVVPMALLFLASFFHMLYYGYKAYRRRRKVTNDIEKLADALYWDILKSPKKHNYADPRIRPVGVVLDAGCDDFTKVDKKACHEKVRDAIDIVTAIKHGEVLETEKLKLDKSNPYAVQNGLNMLKHEPQRAEEVLRRMPYYDKRVIKEALKIFAEEASPQQLDRYIEQIDRDVLMHIVDTMEKREEKNRIPLDMLGRVLTTQVQLDECDYMILSKKLVKHYTPHELLAFFEKLAGKDEKAFKAYLFTLIEFEMLDKANELMQDTQRGEYLDFKAYLDLRKAGKHYPIDLLLTRC